MFDPIETGIRRRLVEEIIRGELDAALSRPRYGRLSEHAVGYRGDHNCYRPSAWEPGTRA
jgi:hypothetical protein